jgi:hypothetical protein
MIEKTVIRDGASIKGRYEGLNTVWGFAKKRYDFLKMIV